MDRSFARIDEKSRKPSRREVLKLGTTAAVGTALAGVNVPWVHAAEANTIRLALIGCGGRGCGAVGDAFSVADGPIQLYAMADLTEDRVQRANRILAKEFSDRVAVPSERQFAGFDAYRGAIDCLRAGDVAMLTAYAYCRPRQLEYAVSKGVNVFMEKSFAPDPAGCRRILVAGQDAAKRNLKIALGLQCRHSVARQALIEKIRGGALGQIELVRATRGWGGSFLAKPPAGIDHVAWQIDNRLHFLWASAGMLSEMLIHQIDECCWIKDAWPVSAEGKGTLANRSGNCAQNFDTYSIEYIFPDGGKAVVENVDPFATFIHGSQRAAQFSGNVHAATVHIYKGKDIAKNQIDWAAPHEPRSPWQAEWKDLIEAIRNDRPYNEAERGIKANLAAIMGRAAVHMGRTVTWNEVTKSAFAFAPQADHLKFGGPAPVKPDTQGDYPVPIPGKWVEV
ncbi:MAG: gfo/Idh/MocA family oxidoreductase [Thermoguttaceae bacterium]|jgi:predicted dehydrogenase